MYLGSYQMPETFQLMPCRNQIIQLFWSLIVIENRFSTYVTNTDCTSVRVVLIYIEYKRFMNEQQQLSNSPINSPNFTNKWPLIIEKLNDSINVPNTCTVQYQLSNTQLYTSLNTLIDYKYVSYVQYNFTLKDCGPYAVSNIINANLFHSNFKKFSNCLVNWCWNLFSGTLSTVLKLNRQCLF